MNHITFDSSSAMGRIKPMHGVGQPPMMHANLDHLHWLTEAGIPYSRLHDAGGPYGGHVYVDIPNIFRNFDADETDPKSYSFAFTDHLIKGLMDCGVEPIYRLGITIENYTGIEALYTDPPKDFAKWARICEHVIRHYNEDWANGFRFGITYWEIWNEPEGGAMWHGSKEQYYRLYETAAKHLKACFGDSIKIGGPASVGFMAVCYDPQTYGYDLPKRRDPSEFHLRVLNFFHGFLAHVRATESPMDFFSWHSYLSVEDTVFMSEYCHEQLKKYGLADCEVHLNEWNNGARVAGRGTSYASAHAAAMMLAMQNQYEDVLCYYDARIGASIYGGMFNPITFEPFCTYYSFKAFGELYALGTQTACSWDAEKLYAVSAADGEQLAAMIANIGEAREFTTNLPAGMKAYLVDETRMLEAVPLDPAKFTLHENTVVLFKNY